MLVVDLSTLRKYVFVTSVSRVRLKFVEKVRWTSVAQFSFPLPHHWQVLREGDR